MGLLLNTLSPAILYEEMAESTYFVDKTAFIGQMLQRIAAAACFWDCWLREQACWRVKGYEADAVRNKQHL